jgi:hypothetical protein
MCRRFVWKEILEWQRFRLINDRYRVAEQGAVFHYQHVVNTGAVYGEPSETSTRPCSPIFFGCLGPHIRDASPGTEPRKGRGYGAGVVG